MKTREITVGWSEKKEGLKSRFEMKDCHAFKVITLEEGDDGDSIFKAEIEKMRNFVREELKK